MPTVLGSPELQRTGFRRTFSPGRGYTTQIEYQGTFEAVAAGEREALLFQTQEVEADYTNPPIGKLTIRTPDIGDGEQPAGNGILSTSYDLDGNANGKHIFEHPRAIALGDTVLDAIRTDVERKTTTAGFSDDASTIRTMMKCNQDTFLVGQFVFKVTHIIANDSEVQIAYANTSCIYSNDALITETEPTALYETGITEAYNTVLNDFYGGVVPTDHMIGWLKNPPSLNNVAGNRSAVVVQYWLEAWRTFTYPIVT